jgi:formylglycine-generating enzyme required for sulfatase activity
VAGGRVVVVVGAGASIAATRGAGTASWRGLLQDGLEYCAEFGDPPVREPELTHCLALADAQDVDLLLAAASVIESRLGAPHGDEWRRWLKQAIGDLVLVHAELRDALCSLNAPLLTTNYDSLLLATNRGSSIPAFTWRKTSQWVDVLNRDREGVLHLHGWWDEPESVVLGFRSYDAVLNAADAQEIQRALGRFNSFVFVGYGSGLMDPNFRPLTEWLRERAPNHHHFILLSKTEVDSFDRDVGLVPVAYGPTHDFLVPFLYSLRRTPGSHRSAVPRDAVTLLDPLSDFVESEAPPTPRMIVIPPGEFEMGGAPGDPDARDVEHPQHRVHIDYTFAVSAHPVTFDDWDRFIRDVGYLRPPDDAGWGRGTRPVIHVHWFDVEEYVAWLNSLASVSGTYRLLTEAEWEYVARAGSTTTRYWWGDDIDPSRANYDASGYDSTTPVEQFPPNAFGLYDLLGNIWEWTADDYHPSFIDAPSDGSAWRTNEGRRVVRGGCWYYDSAFLRLSARLGVDPHVRFNSIGFRIARSVRQVLRRIGRYALICVNSGLAATRHGVSAVVQETFEAKPNQVWELEEVRDTVFVIREPATKNVVTVAPPVEKNYSPTIVASGTGTDFELWEALPEGDGYLFRNCGSRKVLDVQDISLEEGAPIIQFARHGNANQRWWVRPLG